MNTGFVGKSLTSQQSDTFGALTSQASYTKKVEIFL